MKILEKIASVANKSKALMIGAGASMFATASQAAVTFDEATGFGGSIDTKYFTTAAVLVVTLLGVVIAIKYGLSLLRR